MNQMKTLLAGIAVLIMSGAPEVAQAQQAHPVLQQARESLSTYHTDQTVRTIERLRSTAFQQFEARDEARFLAIVAAVHQLVIAERSGELGEMTRRLATVYEVAPDVLFLTLFHELLAVEGEAFTPTIDEAFETLDTLDDRGRRTR